MRGNSIMTKDATRLRGRDREKGMNHTESVEREILQKGERIEER